MPEPILTLRFPISRSNNLKQAVKLAGYYNDFQPGDPNVVKIGMKEIFEKWEFFNLLFWRTVDWKGMTLTFDGMEFHSHCDKTRIFYALQHAHVSYICFLEAKIKEIYKVPFGKIKLEELDAAVYSESDMNLLIDCFDILNNKLFVKKEKTLSEGIKIRQQPRFLQSRLKTDYQNE
ncbi:MAG: hypothetical protein AB2L20_15065 [Mangrovibacterium sp.]